MRRASIVFALSLIVGVTHAGAQGTPPATSPTVDRPRTYDRQLEVLEKKVDDLEWRARTEDIATMDKWWIDRKSVV